VPGYSADTWYGVFAPRGTPKPIVAKLHDTIARALQTPEMKEKLLAQGAEPSGNPPEQFAAFLKSEIAKWGKVIKDSGAKAE
jgi:tripartite-type tricarboxylate transporter receptor subunit TctC